MEIEIQPWESSASNCVNQRLTVHTPCQTSATAQALTMIETLSAIAVGRKSAIQSLALLATEGNLEENFSSEDRWIIAGAARSALWNLGKVAEPYLAVIESHSGI